MKDECARLKRAAAGLRGEDGFDRLSDSIVDVCGNPRPGEIVGVTDIPDLEGLRERLDEKTRRCIEDPGKIQPERYFIAGSFARGVAKSNESDLDVVITFSNPDGNELTNGFDAASTGVVICLQESLQRDIFTPEQLELANGIDVIDTNPSNELLTLEQYTIDTREEETSGEKQIYDLDNQTFVSRSELLSQVSSKGGIGQLEV